LIQGNSSYCRETKSKPIGGGPKGGETDRWIDEQTDGQTERQNNILSNVIFF